MMVGHFWICQRLELCWQVSDQCCSKQFQMTDWTENGVCTCDDYRKSGRIIAIKTLSHTYIRSKLR